MSTDNINILNENVPSRIKTLRGLMQREGIAVYLIPDSDFHDSEYIGDYFKCREYMSGFTGSNGILAVTMDEAVLWTDGRYFIQAERELRGSGIEMYRMGEEGVPTYSEYIVSKLRSGETFGCDGRVLNARTGKKLREEIEEKGAFMRCDLDLTDEIWTDRPELSSEPVISLGFYLTGESITSKLKRIRVEMQKKKAEGFMLSSLDDIMWTTNMRGGDIEYSPVALSYLYVTLTECVIFINIEALTDAARNSLVSEGIIIRPYGDVLDFMSGRELPAKLMIDSRRSNYGIYSLLESRTKLVDITNPTEMMEACKNDTEIGMIRDVYTRDSAALTRFLYLMKTQYADQGMDEYTAALKLDGMRLENEGCYDLSFETISAYGSNAAMMHYSADKDNCSVIRPEGMYLVDSGGQYDGGTTDVTRTIAVGPITAEMKKSFTLVCVGMLRLAGAVFLSGCTGRSLDILAREPLLRFGTDYKCGTGHGVGYMLGVHTGPQRISPKYSEDIREAVLKPGMIVSDEPGVYIKGEYGIRTENILEIVEDQKTTDGTFLRFEHLTWVPIDLDLIDTDYMEPSDIELLNEYHEGVYEKIIPYMQTEEERDWLFEATRPLL